MDLRFQPFQFIDSFRTLCPLKDIEACADVADTHIMDGFGLFSSGGGFARNGVLRRPSSPLGDLRALASL